METAGRSWSTDEAPGDCLSYWTEVVGEAIFELTIDAPRRHNFQACLKQYSLGTCDLSLIQVGEQLVQRTRGCIARSREAQFDLLFVRRGKTVLRQYGRMAEIESGACVLIDSRAEYTFSTSPQTEHVVIHCPETWLRTLVLSPEDGTVRPIDTTSSWGAALIATLSAIAVEPIDHLPVPPGVLGNQIGSLLSLVLGSPNTASTKHSQRMFLRLMERLDDCALDPDLDAASLATSFNVSTRYLHSLFASAHTTYSRELYRIRLERSAQLLRDRRFATASISDIAARCGFTDPSHFARRFRDKFKVTPGSYRLQS